MMSSVIEPIYILNRPNDTGACPSKLDARIESIEKRPRKRVDIFLSQQRTREKSFRIDVLNQEDPHYAIRFANLPMQLAHSFVTLDMECSNFKLMIAPDFLTAFFGCLYSRLFELTSEQTAEFVRHASHQVDQSRNHKSLGSVQQWFGQLEKYFNIKVWLLDVDHEILWKSNRPYIANKTLNVIVVRRCEQFFSLLHRTEDLIHGVMTSKHFKDVLTNLSNQLKPVDAAYYRK